MKIDKLYAETGTEEWQRECYKKLYASDLASLNLQNPPGIGHRLLQNSVRLGPLTLSRYSCIISMACSKPVRDGVNTDSLI